MPQFVNSVSIGLKFCVTVSPIFLPPPSPFPTSAPRLLNPEWGTFVSAKEAITDVTSEVAGTHFSTSPPPGAYSTCPPHFTYCMPHCFLIGHTICQQCHIPPLCEMLNMVTSVHCLSPLIKQNARKCEIGLVLTRKYHIYSAEHAFGKLAQDHWNIHLL